ncbi:hypothetical protein HPP92_013101 [Vanilla planifolia]|uniref:Uncharacterized protein n=1 Tax=Vanilla planifolia TaxID=51239 RepID=A0A835UXN7_VANPL|nr:hypothetical protein HPP92_013101 [Vanilla planifolia]
MTSKHFLLFFFVLSAYLLSSSSAARKLSALVEKQPLTITYHKGPLLAGPVSVDIIWYGNFTSSQRAVVSDFFASLSAGEESPSVSSWWTMTRKYYFVATKHAPPRLTLGGQTLDEDYSRGKSLKNADIEELAAKGRRSGGISVVLTAKDVAVEGFCMSRCATHGSSGRSGAGRFAYIWGGTRRLSAQVSARGRSTSHCTVRRHRLWWRLTATLGSMGW